MNNYILFFLIIFFCIILPARRRREASAVIATKKIKNKKLNKEERMKMYELLKRFIGKKCNISIINSSAGILGTITEVQDNWVIVDTDSNGIDAINIDYITQISEWERKKKK
ncbi:MAG: hypothetical protein IJ035_06220 [Oscillospiraceae bacterium]|nr:hypothetical protein [Oscillospiraceae bacterium]